MLALQPDSAWVLIVAISFVTLPVVLLSRRLLNRPGGLASGLLLSLPLALPLVAAFMYRNPVLPEIGVLRPATLALLSRSGSDLDHLLLLGDASGRVIVPYALTSSSGPWLLLIGGGMPVVLFVRRLLGHVSVRRLRRAAEPAARSGYIELVAMTEKLAQAAGLKRVPEIRIMSAGSPGAFATGRGDILISEDLFTLLDRDELEATVAHEIAHLRFRDVRLLAAAGLLRDATAWNPLAHVAFRRLTMDREVEADRRAAALTGKPLAVASSLLKMCGRGRPAHLEAAAGFWPAKGRIGGRVTRLLAVADGERPAAPMGPLPFAVAAVLAAMLAFQVGVAMTRQTDGAIAFVWGAPSFGDARVWSAGQSGWGVHKRTAMQGQRVEPRGDRQARAGSSKIPPPSAAPVIREQDLARWMHAVTRLAEGHNKRPAATGPKTTGRGWQALPLLSEPTIAPVGLYRIERQIL